MPLYPNGKCLYFNFVDTVKLAFYCTHLIQTQAQAQAQTQTETNQKRIFTESVLFMDYTSIRRNENVVNSSFKLFLLPDLFHVFAIRHKLLISITQMSEELNNTKSL